MISTINCITVFPPCAPSTVTCPSVNDYGALPVTVDPKAVTTCQTPRKNLKAAIKACEDDDTCSGIIVGQNADGSFWSCPVPATGFAGLGPGTPVCLYLAAD